MEIDRERQERAIAEARKMIEEAERAREGQRISRGIAEFEKGNFGILQSNELVTNLADRIYPLLAEGGEGGAATLLAKLGECTRCEDMELRERAVMTMSFLLGKLLEQGHANVFGPMTKLIVEWLQFERVYISGFGVVSVQIQQIGKMMLEKGLYIEAEPLLAMIHQIQSGILEKGNTIRGMLAKIQENLATKDILEILVTRYLFDARQNHASSCVDNLLVYLGRRAVIFLLNRLMHSDSKQDRFLLMRLIPSAGSVAVPVLVDCLKKNPQWYVIRNVVYIISEIGDPSLYSIIQPYLRHRDIRVQQEVVGCIAKLNGSGLKNRLLEALDVVDDELKGALVVQLAELGGEGVVDALLQLLKQHDSFAERIEEDLLIRIILALRNFPETKCIIAIEEFIGKRLKESFTEKIVPLAAETLYVLRPKLRHEQQKKSLLDDLDYADDPKKNVKASANVRNFEEEISSLVRKGDLDQACQRIFNRCVTAAQNKDFLTAEMLRDRLLEINPMALSVVINAGEIIEEEKNTSITGNHIKLWADLYDRMSTDEFTALHRAMQPEKYRTGEIIVESGEIDASLYFINSGFVGIYCLHGAQEVFLKKMQPGDVLGVDQFFSASVWTITLKAQTDCQVNVLARATLMELQAVHQGIEPKLLNFCRRFNIIPELVKMAGSDRREFPRYPVAMAISNILLDSYGNIGKRIIKGQMIDISRGGLRFTIRISNKENANLLLGRQIVTEIGLANGDTLRCFGTIVGVKFFNVADMEFSVHVKLLKKLDQATVIEIVGMPRR